MNTNIRVKLFEKRIKEFAEQENPTVQYLVELNKTLAELYEDNVITDTEFETYTLGIFKLLFIYM